MKQPPAVLLSFSLDCEDDVLDEPSIVCLGSSGDLLGGGGSVIDALAHTLDRTTLDLEILQLAAGIEAFGGTLTAAQREKRDAAAARLGTTSRRY